MKTNGLEIFLQPCTQVSIFVLHFIAKMKLTPSFYFQIPSEKSQPWKTLAIQQKAYPADWDQNKATTNRKKPSSIQSNHQEENRFCPSTQERQQNDNTITQCRSHNKFKWQITFAESKLQTIPESHLLATAMPSVSCITRWGGTGWLNYKALDEPYKAHFARTCIRPEVNWLLFIRLNF